MSYPGAEFDAESRALLFPTDYVNPEPKERYHLVVIGAGPAGLISAIGAAGLGANVALVEHQAMGGDCLNVGCVPSKALLEATRGSAGFDEAFRWLREVRASIAPHDSVERYVGEGVDVFLGRATFDPTGAVCVGEAKLNARRTVVCTGARAALPPIEGLADANPLTNESVFDLTERPESLAILGAGPIGCELATVFARLGTRVDLFEMAERVLPSEEPEASAAVAASLEKLGVAIHAGAAVSKVANGEVAVGDQTFACERVLVALGRRPNTDDLGLEAVDIATDDAGFIRVDAKLRTSRSDVFAAGDCASRQQFTHHADAQARAVIQNALFAPTASVAGLVVPRCTYTKPEVASVGDIPPPGDAGCDVFEISFDELDRGKAEVGDQGFARVYTKKGTDRILAATIVGHDAGEQIAPICLLMSNGLGLGAARRAVLPYPTRAEYLKRLADAYFRTRFTPRVARLFQFWLDFTK